MYSELVSSKFEVRITARLRPSARIMLSLQRTSSEPARAAARASAAPADAPFQTSAIASRKRVSVSDVPRIRL